MSCYNLYTSCNKCNHYMLKCFILLLLFRWALSVPRPFSCMSYLEYSLDDEDDFDEYNAVISPYATRSINNNNNKISTDNLISEDNDINVDDNDSSNESNDVRTVPHRRICELDYTFCFSLWRQTNNGTHIVKQGCWKESADRNAICSQTECTSSAPTSRNNSLYYCCCSGDMCNEHVAIVEPAPLLLSKNSMDTGTLIGNHNKNNNNKKNEAIASTSVLFLTTCAFIMSSVMLLGGFISYYYCRRAQLKPIPEEAPLAPAGPGYSSNLRNVDNINLICMLGSGKYGTVMKGLLHDQEVAVKIFAEHNFDYYINERNIYSLPFMDSPALLNYFGYDERLTLEGKREFHLVLSLAPLGCLQDYLAANTLDFDTFCGMIKSITRGLSHLHTELRHGDGERKPCIAHRDFNTRNILVKSDLSCCLADFGFALKLWGSRYEYKGEQALAETKSINEVGTLRYMAPELLDGAVNLRDCETSLKTVDVYALGLVLWEVSTRCVDLYKVAQQVVPYMSPFQQEVGLHPSFDQMQSLVVRHKARPLFPLGWGTGGATPAAKLLRDTCEDCWDHDAEARLTSLCAEERMHEVSLLRPHAPTSPLLSANNLVTMKNDNITRHDIPIATSTTTTNAIREVGGGVATPNEIVVVVERKPNVFSTNGDDGIGDNGTLFPPPNRQLYPNVVIINGKLCAQSQKGITSGYMGGNFMEITEKNHLLSAQQQQQQQEHHHNHYQEKHQQHQQQQLQPYQGRNPCQERNLATNVARQAPVLIERSKKHSFQNNQNNHDQENSLSCFEYDVSVEELIAGAAAVNNNHHHHHNTTYFNYNNNNNNNNKKYNNTNEIIINNENSMSIMGEGFPKQHNYDKNLRGWHGVRVLIQKKLFHRYNVPQTTTPTTSSCNITNTTTTPTSTSATTTTTSTSTNDMVDGLYLNKKSNLVQQNQSSINYNNFNKNTNRINNNNNNNNNNMKQHQRNLSISSIKQNIVDNNSIESMCLHSNMPSIYKRPNNLDLSPMETQTLPQLRSSQTYTGTPAHVQILPRSYSNNLMQKNNNNNNKHNGEKIDIDSNSQRRQHSLEVFREVFGQGSGSLEKLRNPSQRVKTPGDVPPSVRKVRATKALSLYDDRMMDSSTLNIL